MWADAGECDANPGFMTNNCKVACKKCTLPVQPVPTKKPKHALPVSPATVLSKAATTVQQGANDASEAAGQLISTGKEAVTSLLTNATAVKDSVMGGSKGQNKGGESVLEKAGKVTAVVSNDIKQALALAANASRGDTAEDAPGAVKGKRYDDSQVRHACLLTCTVALQHCSSQLPCPSTLSFRGCQ